MVGGSKQTTTSSNKIDPALMSLYQQNYASAQGVANTPFTPYTGQQVAPINSTESTAGGILGNIATNNPGTTNFNGATTAANGVLSANTPTIDPSQLAGTDLSPYLNPYTSNVIDTTNAQIAQQRAGAQTADNQAATAAKAFGGSRSGVANGITNQLYDQDTASTDAQLNSSNFSQAQNAALQDIAAQNAAKSANATNTLNKNAQDLSAGNLLDTTGQQQFSDASTAAQNLGQYGVLQQQTGQAANDAQYLEFLRQIGYGQQQQNIKNSALGIIPVQSTSTSSTTSNPSLLSTAGGILGGIGSIATAFSDERLKKNIEPVTKDDKGRQVSSWNWKWDNDNAPKSVGYIAQNLRKTDPQAVRKGPGGILMVDYNKVAA